MRKAVKFGGSSLACAAQFQKVRSILREDPSRRYIIPSAPGRRDSQDFKVTDLFYRYYDHWVHGREDPDLLGQIGTRYQEIIRGLSLDFDLKGALEEIRQNIQAGAGRDYAASRGEYLNGRLLAQYLGFAFLDPAEAVFFDETGALRPEATDLALKQRLTGCVGTVIPGFYGSLPSGRIKTFSRGGSDITGALVAKAVSADLYENWTDVSGFLLADPRIVENPVAIGTITYQELHELACMGACVLHEDAIFPVKEAGIPIHIKNTNRPQDLGTLIVPSAEPKPSCSITGITGKKGYCALNIRKASQKASDGFDQTVLDILEARDIPCEPLPSGAGTLSLLVPQERYLKQEHSVLSGIHRSVQPDSISLESDLALVAIGGRGNRAKSLIAGNVISALEDANIHIRTINQGMEDLAMVIGVYDRDFESAVRVIYNRFIRQDWAHAPS